MGIHDRDWYREEMRQRHAKEQAAAAKPAPKASTPRKRIPVDLIDTANPPKLWGADWHWSLQLLVWLAIAALLLMIWRIAR
ncbi:hypothetical protein J2738_003291 [Variovorax paradoxus]|uniref:Uncharacterized protein n=1 Tax=Variovorax paradoxus TaxID=34073 RepID=A0AAE3XX05_VARPD|nr:hypothetical protein [Variovorax paradoxus]